MKCRIVHQQKVSKQSRKSVTHSGKKPHYVPTNDTCKKPQKYMYTSTNRPIADTKLK